jgi:GNAT superfamily N-acetyltransferase
VHLRPGGLGRRAVGSVPSTGQSRQSSRPQAAYGRRITAEDGDQPAPREHQRPRHLPAPVSGRPLIADTACMAELRAAKVEDVSAIAAMDPASLGSPGEIHTLAKAHTCLVALEHGEIVGFLAVKPGHFYKRDFIELLFVAPSWRRHGIGRALMRAALRGAMTSRVFVSTNESNTPMRELLRSEGWSPSGVLTGLDECDPEHVFFHDANHHAEEPAAGPCLRPGAD